MVKKNWTGSQLTTRLLTAFAGNRRGCDLAGNTRTRDNAYIFRTGRGKRSFPSSAPVTAEYGSTF